MAKKKIDKKLMKSIKDAHKAKSKSKHEKKTKKGMKKAVKGKAKIKKVMTEFKEGKLHSGSKKGPEVTNKRQALAIALSEARRAGEKVKPKGKKAKK